MTEVDGARYVYAGVTEGRAKCGVGIIVAERLADCVRSWRCASERCVMIRLRVAGVWMTLVQVYAPTMTGTTKPKIAYKHIRGGYK